MMKPKLVGFSTARVREDLLRDMRVIRAERGWKMHEVLNRALAIGLPILKAKMKGDKR